jgi:hypothetical protein
MSQDFVNITKSFWQQPKQKLDGHSSRRLSSENSHLAKALAKCLHSPRIGHALQFGLLLVQKTCAIKNWPCFNCSS